LRIDIKDAEMKIFTVRSWVIGLVLLSLGLTACGTSQVDRDAVATQVGASIFATMTAQADRGALATQVGASIFATLTAQAPTSAPTLTSSPMPTATSVPPTQTATATPTETPVPQPIATKGPLPTVKPKATVAPSKPPLAGTVAQTLKRVHDIGGAMDRIYNGGGGEACAPLLADYNGVVNGPTYDVAGQSNAIQSAYDKYRAAVGIIAQKIRPIYDVCTAGGGSLTNLAFSVARTGINDAGSLLEEALQLVNQ
jgi:hypothetical protein